MTHAAPSPQARFRAAYGEHRAAEGRRHDGAELLALPYLRAGPLARQWRVRARSFDAFVHHVLRPAARARGQPLRVLDLGAGNGWLCYRVALAGHHALAVDVRDDDVDGLAAAGPYLRLTSGRLQRAAASFDALPLRAGSVDLAVFNASLHYALDLAAVLREARRVVRPGGRVVVLDSPFYTSDAAGAAMVAEKRCEAAALFGDRADALLGLPFIEYLTRERLERASRGLGLAWRRHRVRYPLWYEARPLLAWLRRRRPPSRFDLWECTTPASGSTAPTASPP
ncbi:MAG TPA: methyltransferase domain-containing protein [Gemmatimonadaceae bacterium]|nr:methyltransferase domain-containing protein [Gemmatimonadaceae bacterium]